MKLRRAQYAALLAVPALLVAASGCSSSSSSSGSSTPSDCVSPGATSTPAPVTANGVTVSGPLGSEPKVAIAAGSTAPTALVQKDVAVGCGEAAAAGSTVTVNYLGELFPSGKVFDASWKNGQPATFPLTGVIGCWQTGVQGMTAGGRRLLICPPDTAYGPQGSPPVIPANATLVFVVDLNAVQASTAPAQ